MTEANDRQVAGEHYKNAFQHWDWVELVMLPYLPAQVTKYLVRWRKKNGLQDLEKSAHFLQKFVERRAETQSDAIAMTDSFLASNEVPPAEQLIIKNLMVYQLGSMEHLQTASRLLNALVEDERAKANPPPAPKPTPAPAKRTTKKKKS